MLNNPLRITLVLALIVLGLGVYILLVDIPQTRQYKKTRHSRTATAPL